MSTTPVLHQQAIEPSQLTASRLDDIERIAHRLARVSWIPDVYKPVSAEMAKPWLPAKSVEQAEAEIAAAGMYLASIGRDLTPMTLKLVYVVNGAVDCMYDLISAQVHAHGHELWVEEESHESATVAGKRQGNSRVHRVTFTYEDAVRGGLTERWSKKDGKKVAVETYAKWTRDMLVARAGKRCAKRVAPEAMLTMPPPINYVVTESGRIHRDDDDDVIDGEIVENPQPASAQIPEGSESRARTGPAVAPAHPGGAVSAGDPAALSGHDEQDEVYANRRRRANAVMGEVGVKTDDGRHELVGTATGGATRSTGRLAAWQVEAIVAFCDRLKAAETDESGGEVDNAGAAVVGASTAPPSSGPVIDQIKAMAKAKGVTQADLLRKAQELAAAADLPAPAALSELDELTESDLADWLDELGGTA